MSGKTHRSGRAGQSFLVLFLVAERNERGVSESGNSLSLFGVRPVSILDVFLGLCAKEGGVILSARSIATRFCAATISCSPFRRFLTTNNGATRHIASGTRFISLEPIMTA